MGRAEKIDCGINGKVIFTGATTEFQLKKGLTRFKAKTSLEEGLRKTIGWYLSTK